MVRIGNTFYNPALIEKIELVKFDTDMWYPKIYYLSGNTEEMAPESFAGALEICEILGGK